MAGKKNRWLNEERQLDTRPGKHTKNYGKSPFFMGKSTISMVIFNSYVKNYQRVNDDELYSIMQKFNQIHYH